MLEVVEKEEPARALFIIHMEELTEVEDKAPCVQGFMVGLILMLVQDDRINENIYRVCCTEGRIQRTHKMTLYEAECK